MNKPGNFFNLKEWVTIPEAADHLSKIFDEEVTDADILRLGLDGHLTLSVYFVNYSYARYGKVVSWEEAFCIDDKRRGGELKKAFGKFTNDLRTALPQKTYELWKDRGAFVFEDDVKIIKGVWDLPMQGEEVLDIEHRWQQLTGGPEVTLSGLDGAFVKRPNGVICQLQESFDDNEFQKGSKAHLESLKKHIAENKINKKEADRILSRHAEERKKYLEERAKRKTAEDYYPAGALPKDSILVVRTHALMDLKNKVAGKNNETQNELNPRAEKTYLTLLGLSWNV